MKGYTDVTEFTTAILEEVGLAFDYRSRILAPVEMFVSVMQTDLDTLKEDSVVCINLWIIKLRIFCLFMKIL